MFNLSTNIFDNLPGRAIQYKMAPNDRKDLLKTYSVDKNTRKSATLLLIYKKNNDYYSVLIKRSEYNGHHSGQISFPGGKFEISKDANLQDTAIRETFEEIGVKINKKNIAGKLTPLFIPLSNIMVYPFVAFINHDLSFTADKTEVKKIIEYKLSTLLNPKTRKTETIKKDNKKITTPYFLISNEKVWGATAMILNEFIYLTRKIRDL